MSSIIPSRKDGNCGICLETFDSTTPRFTHEGGEKHDGFHKNCLALWLDKNPSCPIDRTPIDPDTFLSLKGRVQKKVERTLTTAAHSFGIAFLMLAALMAIATASAVAGGMITGGGYESIVTSDYLMDRHIF